MDNILEVVIDQRESDNNLIKKASDQVIIFLIKAITSFVKNEYTPAIIHNLNSAVITSLKQYADKNHLNLVVNK